jgi:two-component system sensor histidine kinase/response regulator
MTPTILIVDDIAQNIQIAAQQLKDQGYRIIFATSGKKAVSMVKRRKIDLILMDVMMPEMNGFEACRKIKADHPEIPVIFLTAKNDSADVVKGFEAGGADYITKPFYGRELQIRVRTHLDLKVQKDKLAENKKQLQDLLHIISHDLRNSLSGIVMTMDLADAEGKSIEEFRTRLDELSRNGLNLLSLVRTMLSLDEKALQCDAVDLKSCLEQSLRLLEPEFRNKSVLPEPRLTEDYRIHAEETSLINSVLLNVLTNALKFSYPETRIALEGRREEGRIVLEIRDTGTGIDEEMLPHLFDIQKGKSLVGTKGEKGTGFGLPLVHKFMKAYGGEIRVDSSPSGTLVSLIFNEAKEGY